MIEGNDEQTWAVAVAVAATVIARIAVATASEVRFPAKDI